MKTTLLHTNTPISNPNMLRLQSLPLAQKEHLALRRIKQWHTTFPSRTFISFSGGKDSTVLLHLVRRLYPDTPAVFVDTGLEYPEIRAFVKTIPNVTWLRPKKTFRQVLSQFGYPVPTKTLAKDIHDLRNTNSSRFRSLKLDGYDPLKKREVPAAKLPEKWKFLIDAPFKVSANCCNTLKKNPIKAYIKKTSRLPYIGVMAEESNGRLLSANRLGCNVFTGSNPSSRPLLTWTTQDIWDYIKKYDLPYASIYDKGCSRTGCMFCLFGYFHEDPANNRFVTLYKTHPKIYNYCMDKLKIRDVINYCNAHLKKPRPLPD